MRRYIAPPIIAVLVHIVCASPASPQTPISFGETLAGSIAVSGEVDTYTFSGTAGDRVMVVMAVTSGGLDPDIRLFDLQGTLICSAQDFPGGSVEINDCTLAVSGAYTLLADDNGNTETGGYGLHLQRLNNPLGTTPLNFGMTLATTIDVAAEKDAYTFTASANDRVRVSIAVTSGGLDPDIELYDPQGKLICSEEDFPGGSVEINNCTLAVSGTYMLLADDNGNIETGGYGLHLQRLNNPLSTTPLSFGMTLATTIDVAAEKDAYTFTASANDRVIVSMGVTSGGLDPDIELYDLQGKLICSAEDFPGGSVEINNCTVDVSGTYMLLADDNGNTETGGYGLHLQRLKNPLSTTQMSFGVTAVRTIDVAAEKDAYTFTASANDRVMVSIGVTSGGLDPDIELYDPQGKLICSAEDFPGGSVEINDCTLALSGTYTLLADDNGNTETGAYGLHLQRLNNPINTTPLSFGMTLARTIDAAAEKDAYTFTASTNDRVMASMAVASGGLDPDIELYNPQGELICSAEDFPGGSVEINDCSLPVSGTYTLLADDNGNTETGSYSLRLSRGPCILTCAANVPAEGTVSTLIPFNVAAPAPSCGSSITYHWDFGDGSTSTAQDPTHSYDAEGTFQWSLRLTAGDKTCDRAGSVRILPPGTEPSETVFFDNFDTYANGSNLGGQGGWVNRWGGGITASRVQSVSPPQSCRMDNGSGCFASQLYHTLPYLDVLWFSADILGVPTGRRGCHEFDALVRLFNPDEGGIWGSSTVEITLRSRPGEFGLIPGLDVATSVRQVSGVYGSQEYASLESDYTSLVNRWIHLQAKVDNLRHRVDVWVDGEYRASLAMDPAAPPYKGIALDAGEGLGFVDNVRVFTNGPEPGEEAVELTLGTPLPTNISNNRYRYFKVTSQPDRDLLVTVDQTGAIGDLELYGGVGAPPSRGRYDTHESTQTGAAHQSLVFPATSEPGTYYFLVYHHGGPATVPFTILARHPGFHLDRISPSTVSNAGSSTLTLVGSGFSPATRVLLIPPSGVGIAASGTQLVSSVQIHATFNLTGTTTGLYDVRIDDPVGGTATLPDALNVTAGNAGALVATLEAPENVRPDRNYTAWVRYSNSGGSDIRAPLFIVTSPQNVPMRLASTEPFRRGPIQVLGLNMNGPVGVLTPGASFSIPIEFRSATSGNQIQFNLEVMNLDARPLNWAPIESELRPPGIADDAWSAIWSSLRTRLGGSWADYLSTLTAASVYLAEHYREAPGALDPSQVVPQGRLPVPVYSVRDLFSFEFAKASGAISPRPVLAAGLDAFYSAPGLPLTFLRVVPSPIEQRFRLGSLGRGWVHIYDYSLRVDVDGSVTVREPWGQERVFLPAANGAFSAAGAGEHATLTRAGQGYLLKERDGLALSFASNRLAYLEDTNSNRLTMGYTGGALTTITHSSGDRLTIQYNARGRIDSVTDPAGRTTSYTYDGSGEHLLEVEEPGGPNTTYAYLPADASPAAHALSAITFPGGTHRYFGWDNLGRLTGEWRDGEAERLTYAYDTQGTITVSDEATGLLTLRFGHRGQFLASEDSEGHKLALGYDPTGNPTRLQDALGSPAMLTYDSHGNPLGLRDLSGGVTRLTYGSLDRLVSLRDARGNSTSFGYDVDGNLESTEYSDGSREAYDVDALGDLVSYTNRRQQTVHYDRNAKGKVIRKRLPGGVTANYIYDARGNLDTVTDAAGSINLDYDERGFLTRLAYPDGRFLVFQYDDSGRRTSRTDETGFTLRYEYNDAGRLVRLRDTAGTQIIFYQYDAAGRLTREERGNGTSTTYEYDSAGQILHLIHYAPNGTIQSRFDYTYDERGNRTSMRTLAGATTYDYDVLGQLVGVTYPNASSATYEYDAVGNRMAVTENGQARTYHANELNQYTDAGGASFTYDNDGNLTSWTDSSGITVYQYDQDNRIVRVTKPGGRIWQYTYDALGNRVAVTHNGETTRYTHDPIGLTDVVAEHDGGGHVKAYFITGLGLVARIDVAGNLTYYEFDALGSTRQLTDPAGEIVASYDYDSWGNPLGEDGVIPNPFRYAGRLGVMTDEPDALLYMRARHYLPSVGRFTSPDPLLYVAGDTNLYRYVGNSPITVTDPSGTFIPLYIAVGVGVVAFYGGFLYLAERASRANAHTADLNMQIVSAEALGDTARGNELRQQRACSIFSSSVFSSASGSFSDVESIATGTAVSAAVVDAVRLNKPNPFGLTSCGLQLIPRDNPDPCNSQPQQRATESEITQCAEMGAVLTTVIRPLDPNEKTGPAPLVYPGEQVTYTVYFENLKTATAPAQEVFITDNLDADLDWSTFELGEIAFGDVVVTSLSGQAQAEDRFTYGDYSVAIEAAQSSGGGQVSWVLRTLDPDTGELPEDPFAGFLPPEDGTGRGQGHVAFSVQVRADAKPGTQVTNSAAIVFDTNPPISTNVWTSTIQGDQPPQECTPPALCLKNDRFRIDVAWRDFDDKTGIGSATRLSDESGYFTFFDEANAEVFIKVLDACGLSGNFWVFDTHLSNVEYTIKVTDTQTGQTRTIFNPLNYVAPSVLGTNTIFKECGRGNGSGLPRTELIDTSKLPPNGSPIVEEVVNPAVKGTCAEGTHTMCLNNGRFRVHATYENSQGIAKQWPFTSDSGYATFFSDTNVELFIKVLDACGLSGNHWVFASGLTDVKVELYVEDTKTGKVWHASNPKGRVFATILDTQSFFTDCD